MAGIFFFSEYAFHNVHSYASKINTPSQTPLVFPVAQNVVVLPIERTFHEKATILHVFCSRFENGHLKKIERTSRHWYDFAKLYNSSMCSSAISNIKLLADVVHHKMKFFSEKLGGYEKCLLGEMKLVPEGTLLKELKNDSEAMLPGNMFFGTSTYLPRNAINFPSFLASKRRLTKVAVR